MHDGTCVIDGCDKPRKGRGWCAMHYSKFQRFGDPNHRNRGEVRDGKRICPQCGDDKPADDFHRSWCRQCGAKWMQNKRSRVAKDDFPSVLCMVCGRSFTPRNGHRVLACSPVCATRRRRMSDVETTRRYRARKRSVTVEQFTDRAVYERDKWICQICRLPIELSADLPRRLSPSIDHIVPLSKGGAHSFSNCQAAHVGCNASKGARMPALTGGGDRNS